MFYSKVQTSHSDKNNKYYNFINNKVKKKYMY